MHYQRWRKTGTLGEVTARLDEYPDRCSYEDCDRPYQAKGFCDKHYRRLRSHGDPSIVPPRDHRNERNPRWQGDDVSYNGVHKRVRGQRGLASNYGCAHCPEQARYWAYDHSDHDEKVTLIEGRQTFYSVDASRYLALCGSCHRILDCAMVAARRTAGANAS